MKRRKHPKTATKAARKPQKPKPNVVTEGSERQPVTDHDRAILEAERLVQLGVQAKRRGQFEEARRQYELAATAAPHYLHVFYALGKLNYLLGLQEESLTCYAISSHLYLGSAPSMELDEQFLSIRQTVLEGYPKPLLDEIRTIHPSADLLLVDDNTPRHVGHALIDLSLPGDAPVEMRQSMEAYKQSISGTFPAQMDMELEEALYRPAGVAYLLSRLRWEQLGKHPVEGLRRLYTTSSGSALSDAACEAELRFCIEELTKSVGLKPLKTRTPFADLVMELSEVREKNKQVSPGTVGYEYQARQAVEQLLTRPFHLTMGATMLHSLQKSVAFRSHMISRWTESLKLLQTPVSDFLFRLRDEAWNRNLNTPVLQAATWGLKSREVVDLRNGLIHSRYSWDIGPNGHVINMLDRDTPDRIVRVLDVGTCEAFHGLLCICALALHRLLRKE